ncbi:Putative beta-phosphoglucomutase [Chlamydia abortus]|uniref:Beta-phosphoglucomutase n=1 Tax=Paenibacillus residui TaxID=629724 RepID=A0ABW3DAU4_9BACL|nr:Putative beta-phosphoglucomutase [Chlamydia abortus]
MKYQCALFDLDGVLVDTAKYHYLAWKELADQLGFDFTLQHNERLKGVSRMASLDILLEIGQMQDRFTEAEKEKLASEKNDRYVAYIHKMDASELLDGALELLHELRQRGIQIALGSASKNAPLILDRTGISSYFDAIVDGNSVSKAKPDPEVFKLGADKLNVPYRACAVFEDSQAGLEAAKAAEMLAIGIGEAGNLTQADIVYRNLKEIEVDKYF